MARGSILNGLILFTSNDITHDVGLMSGVTPTTNHNWDVFGDASVLCGKFNIKVLLKTFECLLRENFNSGSLVLKSFCFGKQVLKLM
jgi:hypothetical protein